MFDDEIDYEDLKTCVIGAIRWLNQRAINRIAENVVQIARAMQTMSSDFNQMNDALPKMKTDVIPTCRDKYLREREEGERERRGFTNENYN